MTTRYVSVIGASRPSAKDEAQAEELGMLLADNGFVVICGGRDGIMEAVARGARRAGGVAIGILPDADRRSAAPELSFSICTAIGHARNLAVVASADAVIAIGGEWGTLSEIAFARRLERPVITLDSWRLSGRGPMAEPPGITAATSPAEAVQRALASVGSR